VCGRERVLEMHVCLAMITGVGIRNRIPSCEWHNTIKNHTCAYKGAYGRERSTEWERTCVCACVCVRDVIVFAFASSRLSTVHMRVCERDREREKREREKERASEQVRARERRRMSK